MKVSNASSTPVQTSEAAAAQAAKKTAKAEKTDKSGHAAAVAGAATAEGASATISSKARDASKAKEVADGAPDVREAKIAALRQKIAEKKYAVDPDAIADRLVDEHIETAGLG